MGTRTSSPRPRTGAALTQLATPLAVLALLAITAKLTLDARTAEQSHRAAAENALRDYAGLAAWQYERLLASHMRSHLMISLSPIRDGRHRRYVQLPPPGALSDRARECNCKFNPHVLFAFRVDLSGGRLVADRDLPPATIRDLGRHLSAGAERIAKVQQEEGSGTESEMHELLRRTSRLDFDTIGGQPLVLAYGFLMDDNSRPRALYGVASDPVHMRTNLDRILAAEALLPPSLVKGRPNASLLAIRTVHPAVGVISETPAAPPGVPTHTDTLDGWLGGLVTTVAVRPELASSLLIGGIPPTRLPFQLVLLAIATTLAVVALIQMRRARELGRLREKFVANVSHELRTPLTQISMLSETLMLGRERSEAERRDFASVVHREARRLTSLVESVLRFSRGQAAATRVTPEVRRIAGDVADAVETFQPMARAADVTIETTVPDDLTARIDPAAFRQVMLNLFDNAVKFGPRGQTVRVNVAAQNGAVAIAVSDQGRGIPERDRRRVFDAYTRLDTEGQPAVAGAGIGLSVVHDLVTAHGGRIWIDTPPDGGGTRVVFTLPRHA